MGTHMVVNPAQGTADFSESTCVILSRDGSWPDLFREQGIVVYNALKCIGFVCGSMGWTRLIKLCEEMVKVHLMKFE